jgi:hypothetical protein
MDDGDGGVTMNSWVDLLDSQKPNLQKLPPIEKFPGRLT